MTGLTGFLPVPAGSWKKINLQVPLVSDVHKLTWALLKVLALKKVISSVSAGRTAERKNNFINKIFKPSIKKLKVFFMLGKKQKIGLPNADFIET